VLALESTSKKVLVLEVTGDAILNRESCNTISLHLAVRKFKCSNMSKDNKFFLWNAHQGCLLSTILILITEKLTISKIETKQCLLVQLGSDGNYFHWDRYTIFEKKVQRLLSGEINKCSLIDTLDFRRLTMCTRKMKHWMITSTNFKGKQHVSAPISAVGLR
jgi:hypothetical protein